MTDLRSVLDDQIGELPPSTVDIRTIVARQRRGTMLRRVAAGTGVAGLATATAVAVSALPGGGTAAPATVPGGRPTAASLASSASPTCAGPAPTTVPPSPWIDPSAAPTAPPATDGGLPIGAGSRLTAALRAAAAPEVRGLRLGGYVDEGVRREPLTFFGGPCATRDRDHYLAVASLTAPGGARERWFSVYVQASRDTACRVPEDHCTVDRRPDGTVIRVRTDRGDVQGQQSVRVIVVVDKPDGTVLQLVCDGPVDGDPVISVPALKRIGLAPGLTLDL